MEHYKRIFVIYFNSKITFLLKNYKNKITRSPIAIFYRFHSSVCLSDIWYGLYYGEMENEEEENIDITNN